MALIDFENQFKLKHYSTRQWLPNSPLLSLSMLYASSQENGPSEEVRVQILRTVYGYDPAPQSFIAQLHHTLTISELSDTVVLHLNNILGYVWVQGLSLWLVSDGKETYFDVLEATRHTPNKSLIGATDRVRPSSYVYYVVNLPLSLDFARTPGFHFAGQ